MLTTRQLFLAHVALPAHVADPPEIVRASGIYLYDKDGKQYTDLVSGVSVSNVGHCHPRVVQAIREQVGQYMHLMVYGKYIQSPQVELASLLSQNLPPQLQSVYFVNSGSEAIEGALKLARRVTGRSELVACKNAYHGSTMGALSVLGDEEMKYAYRPLVPDIRQIRFNLMEDIQQITGKTAAVLVEPIQAESGIRIPDKEYLLALRQKCNEVGALLILDEIQMGFGRTGTLFAFQQFDIIPDILCLAKAMGGGMPLGAFISSKENMHTLTHHPALGHITTFGGHPVSCAAALESLKVILEDKLYLRAAEMGTLFRLQLQDHPEIREIRQVGLMLGVELRTQEKSRRLLELLYQSGLIVDQFLFDGKSFRIAPPLIITTDEVKEISEKIIACLNQL